MSDSSFLQLRGEGTSMMALPNPNQSQSQINLGKGSTVIQHHLKIPTISGTSLIKKDITSMQGILGSSSRGPDGNYKGGHPTVSSLAYSPAK